MARISEKIDLDLISKISDRLLYLKDKELALFIQEIQTACEHYKPDKVVNREIKDFKFPLEEALH